ncbi:MAG: hypothetical protein UU24_C0007G0010 [Candidatus Nomurabacteria bacterium GW2011_GWA2_40_9]|uniref:Fimbrial assembly family protein n=1 Tax=Candidatus Nomurabacteria bacterium GW2011_GWA2_40_9 TaxID=1618734 RepID=A0A0G0TR68_9BACT|nr:MAG: hypothetical protein UU24_C0007G0010 [Candidatus Nomurabacteria bacterium GW2011_GWA2_40_9]
MEQNFQTSFIPKKPIVREAPSARPVGFLTIISIVIFFTMVISSGGIYFYKASLVSNIAKMEEQLNIAKNRFEPTKITQLQLLDKRLHASNEILASHIAVSPIFKVLSAITMKTVRYTNFSYEMGATPKDRVSVKLTGQAVGYRSVALQSDLFTKNKNLIDPVFSDLALDDKGNVIFNLEFSVDPSFVDYKQNLLTQNENDSTANNTIN